MILLAAQEPGFQFVLPLSLHPGSQSGQVLLGAAVFLARGLGGCFPPSCFQPSAARNRCLLLIRFWLHGFKSLLQPFQPGLFPRQFPKASVQPGQDQTHDA